MASKIFLDVNILLDVTLKRDHYDASKQIVELAVVGKVQAFISSSVLHIIGYWLKKAYGTAKTKEIILSLLADITVIDINHETALNAIYSRIDDVEDAIQYYTAIHNQVDYFITRDKQLRKLAMPSLPIYTPEEFLKEFA
jgi:predicted nucleic acid-binding protein